MFNNKYITRYNVISKQTLHFSTILLFNSDHGISSNSYFFRLFVSITIEKGGRGEGGGEVSRYYYRLVRRAVATAR